MDTVEIRLATKADARLIADMSRDAFMASFGQQNTAYDMIKYLGQQFTKEILMVEVGAIDHIFYWPLSLTNQRATCG